MPITNQPRRCDLGSIHYLMLLLENWLLQYECKEFIFAFAVCALKKLQRTETRKDDEKKMPSFS